MEPLELALFAAVLALPLYLLTQLEHSRLRDPKRIRSFGGSVSRDEVSVDERAEVVGVYDGAPIHSHIVYLGQRYRFDRVMPVSYRYRVEPGELFVEPGLVYVSE